MVEEVSLRRQKSAQIKLKVLEKATSLIGKGSFDDIYVEEICESADISKVTFFKYFPQKEDLLLYFTRVWSLECAVELSQKKREGLQGIWYLFDKISDTFDRHPGMLLSMVGYITRLNFPPPPFPIRPYERKLLHPNVEDIDVIEILSLQQMAEKFLLEAIFKKEITQIVDTKELGNLFVVLFYGGIITAHVRQIKPLNVFLKKNAEIILRGIR